LRTFETGTLRNDLNNNKLEFNFVRGCPRCCPKVLQEPFKTGKMNENIQKVLDNKISIKAVEIGILVTSYEGRCNGTISINDEVNVVK